MRAEPSPRPDAERVPGVDPTRSRKAAAQYVDVRGIQHVVPVTVRAPLSVGAPVPVRTDRDGPVAPAPTIALVASVVIGSTIAVLAGVALALAWPALRHVLGRVNAAGRAREWERLEPRADRGTG